MCVCELCVSKCCLRMCVVVGENAKYFAFRKPLDVLFVYVCGSPEKTKYEKRYSRGRIAVFSAFMYKSSKLCVYVNIVMNIPDVYVSRTSKYVLLCKFQLLPYFHQIFSCCSIYSRPVCCVAFNVLYY